MGVSTTTQRTLLIVVILGAIPSILPNPISSVETPTFKDDVMTTDLKQEMSSVEKEKDAPMEKEKEDMVDMTTTSTFQTTTLWDPTAKIRKAMELAKLAEELQYLRLTDEDGNDTFYKYYCPRNEVDGIPKGEDIHMYALVPGTKCKKFVQGINGKYKGVSEVEEGTIFSVKICGLSSYMTDCEI